MLLRGLEEISLKNFYTSLIGHLSEALKGPPIFLFKAGVLLS